MRSMLYSIHDTVAGVFMSPFVARSRVDAMRQIAASKASPDVASTPVASKPHDFALYELGSYDDESGVITPAVPAVRLASVGDIWADSQPSTVSP